MSGAPNHELMRLYGTEEVYQQKLADAPPLLMRMVMAQHEHHKGKENVAREEERKRLSQEQRLLLRELALAQMAQANQHLRHSHVPPIMFAQRIGADETGLGSYPYPEMMGPMGAGVLQGGSIPLGLDEGMVRMASIAAAAGADMARLEKEGAFSAENPLTDLKNLAGGARKAIGNVAARFAKPTAPSPMKAAPALNKGPVPSIGTSSAPQPSPYAKYENQVHELGHARQPPTPPVWAPQHTPTTQGVPASPRSAALSQKTRPLPLQSTEEMKARFNPSGSQPASAESPHPVASPSAPGPSAQGIPAAGAQPTASPVSAAENAWHERRHERVGEQQGPRNIGNWHMGDTASDFASANRAGPGAVASSTPPLTPTSATPPSSKPSLFSKMENPLSRFGATQRLEREGAQLGVGESAKPNIAQRMMAAVSPTARLQQAERGIAVPTPKPTAPAMTAAPEPAGKPVGAGDAAIQAAPAAKPVGTGNTSIQAATPPPGGGAHSAPTSAQGIPAANPQAPAAQAAGGGIPAAVPASQPSATPDGGAEAAAGGGGQPGTVDRLKNELGKTQWLGKGLGLAGAGLATYGAFKALNGGLDYLSQESQPHQFNQGAPQMAYGVNQYGYPQYGGPMLG